MTSIESSPFQCIAKWTPRAIAVAVGGYYGLGIAYDWGLMALVDRVAIEVIKHFAGYAGIGAFMPTVQWHAAWVVRVFIGVSAGVIYDLIETCVKALMGIMKNHLSSVKTSCC